MSQEEVLQRLRELEQREAVNEAEFNAAIRAIETKMDLQQESIDNLNKGINRALWLIGSSAITATAVALGTWVLQRLGLSGGGGS